MSVFEIRKGSSGEGKGDCLICPMSAAEFAWLDARGPKPPPKTVWTIRVQLSNMSLEWRLCDAHLAELKEVISDAKD